MRLAAQGQPQAPAATEETPVFRTGVTQVRVDVQVTDRDGNVITGLTRDDFAVFDENVPQPVAYFGQDRDPLSLLLLLDVSGSMRRYLDQMASTAEKALRYLRVGDRVGVMLFSRRTEVTQPFTGDLVQVAEKIRDSSNEHDLGAGTAINESILDGVSYLARYKESEFGNRQDRRAVLILTDNLSLNYQTPDSKVTGELLREDTVLNAIVVGKAERPGTPRPGVYQNPDFTPADVFKLAEQTGGEAVKVNRADQTFPEMMERIRTRYTLAYNAPEAKSGTFRQIRVELTPAARQRYSGAVVRARSGYYVR